MGRYCHCTGEVLMKNKNRHLFISKNTVIEKMREDLSPLLNCLKSKQLLEANMAEVIFKRN